MRAMACRGGGQVSYSLVSGNSSTMAWTAGGSGRDESNAMSTYFSPDPGHFSASGAYYPTGHVFAMFRSESAAEAAASAAAGVAGVGGVQLAAPAAIEQAFGKRAEDTGGMPSLGREDQFMRRFVELAQAGKAGLLIEVGDADTDALGSALKAAGALLAYHYRALVIEELVEASPGAEAAAAGEL